MMLGSYVHSIDPVIGSVFGVFLWWYGLSYTLGFLNAHRFIKGRRGEIGLAMTSVYGLSLLLAGGVLLGGRFVEVVFYEWPFYREHLHLIPAFWLGGMATHGLLLGGAGRDLAVLPALPQGIPSDYGYTRDTRGIHPRHGENRELHRRANCRQRYYGLVGSQIPGCGGVSSPRRAL